MGTRNGYLRAGILIAAALSSASVVQAAIFSFSGSDRGGMGTATMNVSITGSTLTATVNNTSPTDLMNAFLGSGGNSPGIAGIGLNVDPVSLLLSNWSLVAYTNADQTGQVTIGGSNCSGCDWVMDTTQAGVTLDYLPQVETGVDGLLYNPAAFSDPNNELPGGNNSVYFTTAILTMNFNGAPTLSTAEESLYIRMQNVGRDGGGSLKLYGTPGGGGGDDGTPLPEPGSLALAGLALLACGAARKREKLA